MSSSFFQSGISSLPPSKEEKTRNSIIIHVEDAKSTTTTETKFKLNKSKTISMQKEKSSPKWTYI